MPVAAAMHGLAASDIRSVPGWYGKLPSLGDFASRRLDADFIEPWDLWLGERLQGLRDSRGEAWLDAYLHSPPWRFLLTPGALPGREGTGVLAGVLLSSVDRVGRYFPLTVVAALPRVPTSAQDVDALLAWMERIEDAALDALQLEWDIEALEASLAGLAPPAPDAAARLDDPLAAARRDLATALAGGGGGPVDLAPAANRQDLASVVAGSMNPSSPAVPSTAPASMLRGIGLWLSQRPERQRILVTRGLPAQHDFLLMFGGGTESRDPHAPPRVALIPEDADLLGMFDAPAPAAMSHAHASTAHGDVLGLFAAPADEAGEKADGAQTRPGDADILALFDALPASATNAASEVDNPPTPDILDLFGAKPDDDGKAI